MSDTPTKYCSNPNCIQANPQSIIEFTKHKKSKDGLNWRCKTCIRTHRKEHAEEIAIYMKTYRKEHTEEISVQTKTYRLKNQEKLAILWGEYYKKNKEKLAIKKSIYYREHLEERALYNADYYEKNRETYSINYAIYYKERQEEMVAKSSVYAKNNPGKVNALNAKKRVTKLQATPKNLTTTQKLEIQALYIEAARLTKETGIKHHVDHILPLQGEEISGLHVPWNLQILTKTENCSKNNSFDGTYENEGWRKKIILDII